MTVVSPQAPTRSTGWFLPDGLFLIRLVPTSIFHSFPSTMGAQFKIQRDGRIFIFRTLSLKKFIVNRRHSSKCSSTSIDTFKPWDCRPVGVWPWPIVVDSRRFFDRIPDLDTSTEHPVVLRVSTTEQEATFSAFKALDPHAMRSTFSWAAYLQMVCSIDSFSRLTIMSALMFTSGLHVLNCSKFARASWRSITIAIDSTVRGTHTKQASHHATLDELVGFAARVRL